MSANKRESDRKRWCQPVRPFSALSVARNKFNSEEEALRSSCRGVLAIVPRAQDLKKLRRIIEMGTPTEVAEDAFQFAMQQLQLVKTTMDDQVVDLHMRSALSNMAWGLKNLSIG